MSPPVILGLLLAILLPVESPQVESTPINDVPTVRVYLNRGKQALPGPDVTIPYNTQLTTFTITPIPGQVRYRLSGLDNWNRRLGVMNFGVRFYNPEGDFVDATSFEVHGKSPGWRGSLTASPFAPREKAIIVPKDATFAEIYMSSAGPPASIGVFAITDVSLGRKNAPPQFVTDWKKGGTRPSMAYSETRDGRTVWALNDSDTKAHADWYSSRVPVKSGEPLQLRWKEIYSDGMGDPLSANYGSLPAGNYVFEVEELNIVGDFTRKSSIRVRVLSPFWHSPWFWGGCATAAILVGMIVGGRITRSRSQRQQEKQQAIDEERRRIARDLHDDLGARISQISLNSSYAANASVEEMREALRSITGLTDDVSSSLSETVWMLNPRNDNLESLKDFLSQMIVSACKGSGVRSRLDVQSLPQEIPISSDFRHHISLAVREAVTNALKHSGAQEIKLHLKLEPHLLRIHVIDDGTGMPINPIYGNGIKNMTQRAQALGGTCKIEPIADGGTRIVFEIPLPS